MKDTKWVSEPLRAAETVSRPTFRVPSLACDCHIHVFGPPEQYAGVPNARYTLPEGSLEQYLAVGKILMLERLVLVQPSYYGYDNSCLISALKTLRARARGVVFLPQRPNGTLIDTLHRLGVRGIRIDFVKADSAGESIEDMVRTLKETAALAKSVDWHIELYSPGHVNLRLLEHLSALDIDFSVNHFGYMHEEDTDGDFERFLRLNKSARCWVKLTAPYRLGPDEQGARADWMAPALIAAAPDRVIWGTDWPHIPHGGRDSGRLLSKLAQWCPDETTRNRILVANPARLYRFSAPTELA